MNKFYFIIVAFLAISCFKKDICESSDCLPDLTTIGKGKIACLIDGKAFSPGGSQFAGPTQQANYNQDFEGKLYFSLSANNRKTNKSISISILEQELIEGKTYILKSEQTKARGRYKSNLNISYETNDNNIGEITFVKFDDTNGIVSGTFWFDAISEEGDVIEIRSGRFDMKYN